jgi:hypothetical protein
MRERDGKREIFSIMALIRDSTTHHRHCDDSEAIQATSKNWIAS